jgi:hypothetical protein
MTGKRCHHQQACEVDPLCLDDDEEQGGTIVVTPTIGPAHALPLWMSASPYIHTGYRLHHPVAACLASMFQLHNETLNIWSHLAAFMVWVPLAWEAARGHEFDALSASSKVVATAVLVLGSLLPLCSAVAHTLHPASVRMYVWMWRLDYAGILVGWLARFVFSSWFLFSCLPSRRVLHGLLTLGVLCFAAFAPGIIFRRDMVRHWSSSLLHSHSSLLS